MNLRTGSREFVRETWSNSNFASCTRPARTRADTRASLRAVRLSRSAQLVPIGYSAISTDHQRVCGRPRELGELSLCLPNRGSPSGSRIVIEPLANINGTQMGARELIA